LCSGTNRVEWSTALHCGFTVKCIYFHLIGETVDPIDEEIQTGMRPVVVRGQTNHFYAVIVKLRREVFATQPILFHAKEMPAIEYMSPIATFEHRMIERKKL
jgi:hypothetical protein